MTSGTVTLLQIDGEKETVTDLEKKQTPQGMWGHSSPTRDRIHVPYSGSMGVLTPGPPGKSQYDHLISIYE